MKRKRLKKAAAWLLTAAMITTIVPVTDNPVQAEETQAEENTSTTKTIAGLGAAGITDPANPNEDTSVKDWTGSYVYYGKYAEDEDETAEPVKYRVLDAETKDYSADGTTRTMLLDCDNVLYEQKFDTDGAANAVDKKANDWSVSDVKNSLNGTGFLNKDGVFTTVEKSAIAESTVAAHALQTSDEESVTVPVASWTQSTFKSYVPLAGEKIFLLDAEDVSNGAYGYSMSTATRDNRKKTETGSTSSYWWLRSAVINDDLDVGCVSGYGSIISGDNFSEDPGVSPALNLNLSSVLFSSVIKGTAGENGAEYTLTLLDEEMTVKPEKGVVRKGDTVTIPYSISGNNSDSATQISVLILDKKYTKGNTNKAKVLAYEKIADVTAGSESGTGTLDLPDALLGEKAVTEYYAYLIAEDVNGEKETDYASEPTACSLWEAPEVKQMNFGTEGIADPALPDSTDNDWKGSYVYYGNYDADGDGKAEPVKYRVLDTKTTDYSEPDKDNKKAETMLLDCDSILYYTLFNEDGKGNNWSASDVKNSLNGDDFLNKDGVFTTAEKSAIAESKKTVVNEKDGTGDEFLSFVSLAGEQIFLLDAKEVTSEAYGYSNTDDDAENRIKTGSAADHYWWLRSTFGSSRVGAVCSIVLSHNGKNVRYGDIGDYNVYYTYPGVSPALNLNLSSVLFSSAGTEETAFAGKSSSLTSESTKIGTTTNTTWKLTLLDKDKTVAVTESRNATKAGDGTITVPYTYTDKEGATEREQVNQISVMITDKEYKAGNTDGAEILYYGALDNIKDAEGNDSTLEKTATGTGIFALPSGLTGKTLGTDYHVYLLAEHVNADNSTDYAGAPVEVKEILNEMETIAVPDMSAYAPVAEQTLPTEMTVSSNGVAESAGIIWKKEGTPVTGNAEWKTDYQAYVTLAAEAGYIFADAKGNKPEVMRNGNALSADDITWNIDGSVTVYCGTYTTATRKTVSVTAPKAPTQFANYYTADDVLSSTELGTTAEVTLEGTAQPNPVKMEVEWSLEGADAGAAYAASAGYDPTLRAYNTFKWKVKESEYAEYDEGTVVLEGTVRIQNKDYTSVSISGSDKTITYDGNDTLDVSEYFTIDKNAGTPAYELVDTSTGSGTITGKTLTMTKIGTFVIKCSTSVNGVYNKSEHTLTITVKKATPTVVQIPTVADRVYHPTVALKDADITGGLVKDVKGLALSGTWSWKTPDMVPTVGNAGYVAVFTPTDKDNYDSVEARITVTVNKAAEPSVKPSDTITVSYSTETVGAVTLPKGWEWTDKTKTLTVGAGTTAEAVYVGADSDCYETVSVIVTITREQGGSFGGNSSGGGSSTGGSNLGESSSGSGSSSGGSSSGTALPDSTTKPGETPSPDSTTKPGSKPVVGKTYQDDSGKAVYKVMTNSANKGTVAYNGPADKSITTVAIPATVTINGVTYKVTAIEKNAFRGCKKLKAVVIGKNILKIGKKAFYGCKSLQTLNVQSVKLTKKNVGSKAFGKSPANMTVKLPKKKYKTYKKMLVKKGISRKAKFRKK